MRARRFRVVHYCASFGFGVVRRATAIRHAITRALAERGVDVERYSMVTASSQAHIVTAANVQVLPLVPERDRGVVLQSDWSVARYVSDFETYTRRLRSVLRSNGSLYDADLIVSDQMPEVFELPLRRGTVGLFVNDYFGELECLGEANAYIDSIVASPALILFADTRLLLERTNQKLVAARFGQRFHLAGPVLDFTLADGDRATARAALRLVPDRRVVYVAHARTPNATRALQALAPIHVVSDDHDALTWAAGVTGGPATLTAYAEGLTAADVVLGKGGRVTTYEACLRRIPVICDPLPGNEKEDVFVKTAAEAGIVLDARAAAPTDSALGAVRARLETFHLAELHRHQFQQALSEALTTSLPVQTPSCRVQGACTQIV